MVATSLALGAGLYAIGLTRPWRHAGIGGGIRAPEALAFAAGWLTIAAALSPALDEWSDRWLAAHMIQHELLMLIAAPLVAMGAPWPALLWALPARARRRLL